MSKVLGIRITMQQVFDSEAVAVSGKEFVVPKKATILSGNGGTLIEAESGGLYLIPIGDWFRSSFYGKSFPQVDGFNELQDKGFTAVKDKMFRHEEKQKQVVKEDGQEVRSKNNVSPKKTDKAVAPNPASEKKD
jgi:hypothetical protein